MSFGKSWFVDSCWTRPIFLSSQKGTGCSVDDLSMAGVVLSHDHLEASLDLLHASHSDAIGAPKVGKLRDCTARP